MASSSTTAPGYGAVPDAPQLAPAVRRIHRRARGRHARSPPTADTASQPSSATCTRSAYAPSRSPAKPNHPPRKAIEHQRGFRRHVKWRTGSEGRISYLKRCYGWDRTRLDGRNGAAIWCGHGVFTHNLIKIAALAS